MPEADQTDDPAPLPARRFGGDRAGPHLLVTAGVHGDEFLPMLAVRELIRRFEAPGGPGETLRGSLTLAPVVNGPAFRRGRRCGEDGRDLARTCPGRADGGPTERIAFALSREIRRADCYVDLHTGGTELCVLPLAGYLLHSDPAILERQRALARAFRLPFLWGTSPDLEGRSLSVARDAGIPAIYVEYLGAHREGAEVASGAIGPGGKDHPLVAGCLGVMRHLGMLGEDESAAPPAGAEDSAAEPEIAEDPRPGSGHMQAAHPAPATGLFEPRVSLGQRIAAGDPVGEIVSEFGDRRDLVRSREEGRVIVLRDYPRIREGDACAVVAKPDGAT